MTSERDSQIRAELENMLASECFSRSERLSLFLRFVVEETLQGRGHTLKEPVLAHELYGRDLDFDGANPIVRVDARRLRDKLREYYASRPGDPVLISLPKGSYVPVFEMSADAAQGARGTARAPRALIPRAAVVALGVCAVIATGYVRVLLRTSSASQPRAKIMLAALPFQNLTGDPEQEYLCDGLTEEMIAVLGRVDSSRLGVIARTSAMHYKNTTKRADEIGRELNVGYLLETSLRLVGARARITAQLIDARTQERVWSEQYERDADDSLALQREVAATVAQEAAASLGLMTTESPRPDRHSTNARAYEHYLRGRYFWAKDTDEGLRRAEENFRQAIELDPSYARAYSGLAETYALLGSYDFMPIGESHPLGREAALKALELDDSLGEAHRALAAIIADHYWDWAEVERHYTRAIALDANDVTTLRFYSFYLAYTGRAAQAVPIAERACRLDPVSPGVQMNLGVVLAMSGQTDAAIDQFLEALELDPGYSFAHSMLALAYLDKSSPERALTESLKARTDAPTRPDVTGLHGYVLARAGRKREALATIDELHRRAGQRDPSPFFVAMIYAGLEDSDRAFDWLEKAFQQRSWELPIIKQSPVFVNLRTDRRYLPLVDRLGLPQWAPFLNGSSRWRRPSPRNDSPDPTGFSSASSTASACLPSRTETRFDCCRATACRRRFRRSPTPLSACRVHDVVLDGEMTWQRDEVRYQIFDVMWLEGRDVTSLPLTARRELLQTLPLEPPLMRVESLDDSRPWERACAEGWEGVIAKRRDSTYEHRRSPHWLKMKCENSQEFVVGGFTDPQGARVGLGALLIGYFDGDDLVFAGKIGTGFDTKLLLELRARLNALEIPTTPFTKAVGLPRLRAHWVRPEVVIQAAFIEWTVNGKLRHPRLLGVRFDKSARDVVREQR